METNLNNIVTTEPNDQVANLYALNKNWVSDVLFIDDEINFLKDLLDKFFMDLIKNENVNRVQLIKMQLISLGFVRKNIHQDIIRHQENIEQKINNISNHSEEFLALEDSRLADEMKDLHKAFKKIKNEIFGMTVSLLHSESHEI